MEASEKQTGETREKDQEVQSSEGARTGDDTQREEKDFEPRCRCHASLQPQQKDVVLIL